MVRIIQHSLLARRLNVTLRMNGRCAEALGVTSFQRWQQPAHAEHMDGSTTCSLSYSLELK
jgi:hypothetical protein